MSRQYVYEARDLVDAGVFHMNVLARCRCGHSAILDSIDLWGVFQRKGWDDWLPMVARHLGCTKCVIARRPKSRPTIELVQKEATVKLPWCDTAEFKRVVRRRR